MKASEVYSIEFKFTGSLTMVSYIRKKGLAIVFLKTIYHSKMVNENTRKWKNTVDHILQQDQGGIDTMDKMVGTSTCQCKRLALNIDTLKAYTFFCAASRCLRMVSSVHDTSWSAVSEQHHKVEPPSPECCWAGGHSTDETVIYFILKLFLMSTSSMINH